MNLFTWPQIPIVIVTGLIGAIPILVGITNAYFAWQPYTEKLGEMIKDAVNK